MNDKKAFVRSVESILKLRKCKLTILPRGAREERQMQRIVKCFAQTAIDVKAIYKRLFANIALHLETNLSDK